MADSLNPQVLDAIPNHRRRATWAYRAAVAILLCGFALVMYERNRIRAYWWAWRLSRADDPSAQAYYLGSLAAVGDSARWAAERLADHERPDVRTLAVIALAGLPSGGGLDTLGRLLGDADQDVAESAALHLAFVEGEPAAERARNLLIDSLSSPESAAVPAAAALSQVQSPPALEALCRAAREHPVPLVRAQAVESLAAVVLVARGGREPQVPAAITSDPVGVLVEALNDRATFIGSLSLERQIVAARAFAGDRGAESTTSPGTPTRSAGRAVAEVAAEVLERLIRRHIDPATPWSTAQLRELAEECRTAILHGGVGPGGGGS